MVQTIIQTFGGNVAIGTKDPGSHRLKVVGTSKFLNLSASSLSVGGVSSAYPPSGIIVMWYGAFNALPTGWKLCDGTNGTPNLISKFVLGWNASYTVGQYGGIENYAFTSQQLTPHSHSVSISTGGSHLHTTPSSAHQHNSQSANHLHTISSSHSHPIQARPHNHLTNNHEHAHTNWIVDTRLSGQNANALDVTSSSGSWTNHFNGSFSGVLSRNTNPGGDHNHGSSTNSGGHSHNTNSAVWDHTHPSPSLATGNHTHVSGNSPGNVPHAHASDSAGDHTHTFTISTIGLATAFSILPSYHALVFIMKE